MRNSDLRNKTDGAKDIEGGRSVGCAGTICVPLGKCSRLCRQTDNTSLEFALLVHVFWHGHYICVLNTKFKHARFMKGCSFQACIRTISRPGSVRLTLPVNRFVVIVGHVIGISVEPRFRSCTNIRILDNGSICNIR